MENAPQIDKKKKMQKKKFRGQIFKGSPAAFRTVSSVGSAAAAARRGEGTIITNERKGAGRGGAAT